MGKLFLLLKAKGIMGRNSIVRVKSSELIRFLIAAIGGLIFFFGAYYLFYRILEYLIKIPILGPVLAIRLMSTAFLSFLAMLLFSNIVIALSTLYLSNDLDFLLSSPLSHRTIFTSKFLETAIHSSWMILLFGLPMFIAYGVVRSASFVFYIGMVIIIIPFLLSPTGAGLVVAMLITRFFPARKTMNILTVMGGLFIGAVILVIRFLKPERLTNPADAETAVGYLENMKIPMAPFLPSYWATLGVSKLAEGDIGGVLVQLLYLVLFTVTTFLLSMVVADRLFYSGFSRSKVGRRAKRYRSNSFDLAERVVSSLNHNLGALMYKDFKIFFRETTQWSQLFLLSATVILYLYSIKSLPLDNYYLKNLMSFLNLGFAGFVLAAVAARFVFPAISLEGKSYWIVKSAPSSLKILLKEKFIMGFIPLVIVAEALIVVSNYLLKADSFIMILSSVTIFIMALGLSCLGVGMGAIFPKFEVENVAQIATGTGGMFFMVLSLIYIGLMVVGEAWPVYTYFSYRLTQKFLITQQFYMSGIFLLILNAIVMYLPLKLGLHFLERRVD